MNVQHHNFQLRKTLDILPLIKTTSKINYNNS
jgi:hypothetical protein